MTTPPPDGSRDRRIEDPSNRWIIHAAARRLLPFALRAGVSANAVSLTGMLLGTGAAVAYSNWQNPVLALIGLFFSACWLIADGLDGMIARATGTAGALGRFLDGICDHGVFALIYIAIATSIGTAGGWALAVTAGVAHAVQSSLYEGERTRFHRRAKGDAEVTAPKLATNPLVRLYDTVAGSIGRIATPFEEALAASAAPQQMGAAYALAAVAPMRLMVALTANARVLTVFLACLFGMPRLFWWVEIVPLTVITIAGLTWHRRVEQRFAGCTAPAAGRPSSYA
ncbi:CDP-alcohol phosphatidyltransferase family protein [Sphingomonas sp.]|uniref:CDP-alcohol phosphatidyltransferase family protein n=1 Tax=Sphingomonas sp. TaxID=28214 RepID=UPI003CC503D7